jgi:4-hydroxybenzoate polyprenyltransferase
VPSAWARLGGLLRLSHPFPSVLDGVVVGAVASIAGADAWTAGRLAVAMIALQVSIGSLNDLIDAPRDAGHKPGKPIPAGLVAPWVARLVVIGAAGLGLILAVPSGPATVVLASAILAIGYGYDLFAKGTAWSWVPFAVGIPLLPVFGWLGVMGSLPRTFAALLPVAVAAGAALAIANASADAERDAAAGADSVALRLGPGRAWAVSSGLLLVVVVAALATLVVAGAQPFVLAAAAVAGLVIGVGVGVGRGAGRSGREGAWELEAVGVGLLAIAWLAGITLAG